MTPRGRWTRAYWMCQLSGWLTYALVTAAIPALFGPLDRGTLWRGLLAGAVGLGCTHALRWWMGTHAWLRLSLRGLATRVLPAAVAIAVVLTAVVVAPILPRLPEDARLGALAGDLVAHIAVVLVWTSLYLGVHYLRGLRASEAEKWRLELAMRDAELTALRSQLNPHFIFNSLNSLRALIAEDPKRAVASVTALAALLRYTLQLSRSPTTSLGAELEAVRHYLALEAIRFEERLRYRVDADPDLAGLQVPPMLVQNLVENAIKHGIAERPEGGTVEVEVGRDGDRLHIRVTNTGRLDDGPGSDGIGLANSLERLELLFGQGVSLALTEVGGDRVACDVTLPATVGVGTGVGQTRDP